MAQLAAQPGKQSPEHHPERAPERTVLVVGLLGGLLFAFVTPPFQSPDEPAHFRRADQLAQGTPLIQHADGALGVDQPASFSTLIAACLAGMPFQPLRRLPADTLAVAKSIELDAPRTVFIPYGELAPYTSASYLALIAGDAVGRWLSLRPLLIVYLMRLCNLAVGLALCWCAVRVVPFQKWFFAFLALDPMVMFLRSAVTPDALLTAAALCLVGLVCAQAYGHDERPTTGTRIAGLLVCAGLVAFTKSGYALLNLLVLLIRPHRFASRGRYVAAMSGVFALSGLGVVNSSLTAREYFAHFQSLSNVKPYAQIQVIFEHPLSYLGLLIADCGRHFVRYVVGFVGNFGWLDTPLPAIVILGFALLLAYLALAGGDPAIAIPLRDRLLIALVVGLGIAFVITSQYVGWTPVGAHFIDGAQGRYFLPLAPAGALLLYDRGWGRGSFGWLARSSLILGFAGTLAVVVSLVRIWTRYHGW